MKNRSASSGLMWLNVFKVADLCRVWNGEYYALKKLLSFTESHVLSWEQLSFEWFFLSGWSKERSLTGKCTILFMRLRGGFIANLLKRTFEHIGAFSNCMITTRLLLLLPNHKEHGSGHVFEDVHYVIKVFPGHVCHVLEIFLTHTTRQVDGGAG